MGFEWNDQQEFYGRDYFTARSGHYDENDRPTYDPQSAKHSLERLVEFTQCKTALDGGCANGHLVHGLLLQDTPVDAYGFDISTYAVSHVRAELADRIVVADVSDHLPYDDDKFDLVITYDLLEHLKGYDKIAIAVKELCRVARKFIFIRMPTVVIIIPPSLNMSVYDWVETVNCLPHKARLALIDVHPYIRATTPSLVGREHPSEHPREFWIEMFAAQGFKEQTLPDSFYLYPNSLGITSFDVFCFVKTPDKRVSNNAQA